MLQEPRPVVTDPADHSHDPAASEAQVKLDEITSRELNARNLVTYADEALEDLVALVSQVVEEHGTGGELDGVDEEQWALELAGLDPNTIEMTLDHIASVADSTNRLDDLIAKKRRARDQVVVPPDHREVEITVGDASFERPKEIIPKLKTLLLLLEKGLDIDIESDDVKIEGGIVLANMMRPVSYDRVEIVSLHRRVLVCDAVGETTFVFDTDVCDEHDISADDVENLSKSSIKDLIKDDPRLGRQIDYSNYYAAHLITTLTNPIENVQDEAEAGAILKPKTAINYLPDGYVRADEVMDKLGVSSADGLTRKINKIGRDVFGEILYYKSSNGRGGMMRIFSSEQQTLLDSTVAEGEVDEMPDGYLSYADVCEELGIAKSTLDSRIKKIGKEQLGIILRLRNNGNRPERILSPRQRAIVRNVGDAILDHVPEGYISVIDQATELGISSARLRARIAAIGSDVFGEVAQCRLPGKVPRMYILSPNQQQILRSIEWGKRELVVEELLDYIPEGYVTWAVFARKLGIRLTAFSNRVQRQRSAIGPVSRYREPGTAGAATRLLSPEQQTILEAQDREIKSKHGQAIVGIALNKD